MYKTQLALIAAASILLAPFPVMAYSPANSVLIAQAREELTVKGYILRAMDLTNQGKLQEAFEAVNKAIELEPTNNAPYLLRAALYRATNQPEKAIKDCTKIVESGEDFDKISYVYFFRGHLYFTENRLEEALHDFNTAIAFEPTEPDYYYLRGATHFKLNHPHKALADFTVAVRTDDVNSLAFENKDHLHYFRGVLYAQLEDYNKALIELNQAINITKDKRPEHFHQRSIVNWNLADFQSSLSDAKMALELYRQTGNTEGVKELEGLVEEIKTVLQKIQDAGE